MDEPRHGCLAAVASGVVPLIERVPHRRRHVQPYLCPKCRSSNQRKFQILVIKSEFCLLGRNGCWRRTIIDKQGEYIIDSLHPVEVRANVEVDVGGLG